jgi:predicted permease
MTGLKILFAFIVLTMIAVTGWASTQCAIWQIPASVASHPWFIATLFDAYFGFLTFYCWVFYKERSILLRIFWFVAIMLLGNMGMATYMLIQLLRQPAGGGIKELLRRRGE